MTTLQNWPAIVTAFGWTYVYSSIISTEYSQILMFKEPVYGKIIPGHVTMTEKVAYKEHNNLI